MPPPQLVRVNYNFLDSVMKASDTSYSKKYGTTRFNKAFYFVNTNDSTLCQVMKDTADSVRQVIITTKHIRSYYAEYYPNGQLIAKLPLDSMGQYDGAALYYYQDGQVESAGEYKRGFKTGDWKNYNEQGMLVNTGKYDTNGQVYQTIPAQ